MHASTASLRFDFVASRLLRFIRSAAMGSLSNEQQFLIVEWRNPCDMRLGLACLFFAVLGPLPSPLGSPCTLSIDVVRRRDRIGSLLVWTGLLGGCFLAEDGEWMS